MKLAAIVFAVKIWRHYLYRAQRKINIDHQRLKYVFSQKRLNLHETSVVADPMSTKKGNVVADALNKKAQHTMNSIVII